MKNKRRKRNKIKVAAECSKDSAISKFLNSPDEDIYTSSPFCGSRFRSPYNNFTNSTPEKFKE